MGNKPGFNAQHEKLTFLLPTDFRTNTRRRNQNIALDLAILEQPSVHPPLYLNRFPQVDIDEITSQVGFRYFLRWLTVMFQKDGIPACILAG
jgi:hypothetical protein